MPIKFSEPETQFQYAVVELAEILHWRTFHAARIKGHLRTPTSTGFPDLVLARSGVKIFSELKTNTGEVSNDQILWLRATEGVIWRPKYWELIEKSLKEGLAYPTEPIPRMR